MDKIAANNHFVVLKKEIKKSKAMVIGNLVRKLNKHKQDKDKIEDEEQIRKIDSKIARIHEDIKLLKKIDPYGIAKKATFKTDLEYWNKLISDSKAKSEDVLTARVIVKSNIQKQVAKFRNDHKDCDEWLNEYIEYREKKKELISSDKPIRRKSNSHEKEKKFVSNKTGVKKRGINDDHNDNYRSSFNSNRKRKLDKRSPEKLAERVERRGQSNIDREAESLHPSWESKRKEKELLKAAFSGQIQPTKKLIFP